MFYFLLSFFLQSAMAGNCADVLVLMSPGATVPCRFEECGIPYRRGFSVDGNAAALVRIDIDKVSALRGESNVESVYLPSSSKKGWGCQDGFLSLEEHHLLESIFKNPPKSLETGILSVASSVFENKIQGWSYQVRDQFGNPSLYGAALESVRSRAKEIMRGKNARIVSEGTVLAHLEVANKAGAFYMAVGFEPLAYQDAVKVTFLAVIPDGYWQYSQIYSLKLPRQ